MAKQSSFFRSVSRLYPHVKPVLPRLFMGLLSALLASVVALAIPQVLRVLINDSLRPGATADAVWGSAGLILALGVAEAVLVALRRTFVINPATTVETRMRVSLYGHLQDLPVSFHDRWGSGQLLSRAMTDLNFIRRWMAFGAIMLVVTTLTVVIGVVVMFTMSWQLALIFLAAAGPVMVYGFRFRTRFSKVARRSQDQAGDLATTVEESVHGIRVLKAFGRSREALETFNGQAEELRQTEIAKARHQAVFSMVVTLLPELALGAGLVTGIMLAANGQLSIGSLVAFFATAAVIAAPVEFSGMLLAMALTAKTALDRHFEVMDSQNTITSAAEPRSPADVKGALSFNNVTFAFDDAPDKPVLKDVRLDICPGETMALVGITGSGKSALLQLVPRLYDVTAGSITSTAWTFGTSASRSSAPSWLWPSRTPPCSPARCATTCCSASSPETPTPAKRSSRRPWTRHRRTSPTRCPRGWTPSSARRASACPAASASASPWPGPSQPRPAVLVLDDPLSALDVNTEELVENRLREVLAGTTTLIVAHRPSTVALADRVALLEDGRIAAVGTHAELLAGNSHYRHVIASLETEPRDLDSELSALDDAEEVSR
jgi:ATP-binding cassette subfamily B protein